MFNANSNQMNAANVGFDVNANVAFGDADQQCMNI